MDPRKNRSEKAPAVARADAWRDLPPASPEFVGSALRLMADLPALLFAGHAGRGGPVDANINAALAATGEFLAVSRVYAMLDEEGGRFLRNTHEWVSRNIGAAMSSWPLHEHKKDIPSLKPLMKGRAFLAAHTRELPPDLRGTLSEQAVDSVLLAPMNRDGEWIGLVGFDSCGVERDWRAEDADILRHLAGLIALALERKEYLAMRSRLERVRAVLGEEETAPMPTAAHIAIPDGGPSLVEAERRLIVDTLARHHGNRGAAARQLGIAWAALDRRCKKLGIDVKRT